MPLVERYLRLEVDERVDAHGEIVKPLDPAEVERVLDRLLAEKIEALAVCLLNSYANPVHEERIAEIVRRRRPGSTLSVSAEVLPEIREYERIVNHGHQRVRDADRQAVSRHAEERPRQLQEKAPLLIMQSNGGPCRMRRPR